jgi:hypothetical protein
MKLTLVLFVICLLTTVVGAKKITVFPQLNRPNDVIIDGGHLYISDCPSVYIYSFKPGEEPRLQKKFGQEGDGPGEFKKAISSFGINVQPGYIFVNARGKIAYFTPNGELIREKNPGAAGYSFFALKDKLIGRKVVKENQKNYMAIKIFNSDLKEECELTRQLDVLQPGSRDIKAYSVALNITAGNGKIFAAGSVDFIIKIFDYQGKLLRTIDETNRIKRIKIQSKHKEEYHNHMKVVFPEYHLYRERVVFAEYFPAIRRGGLKYDENGGGDKERIYAVTWNKNNDRLETFIFDTKGTLIKKVFLPIKEQSAVGLSPYQVKDGKIYQLIENDDFDWELHVTSID